MKFLVGLAAGVALAAAAVVYASRNPAMQEAFEGIQADLKAGDSEALRARLEAGMAEVRSQVQQRVGPQSDWMADAGAGAGDAVESLRSGADDALVVAADDVADAASQAADTATKAADAVAEASSDAADAVAEAVEKRAEA
jgi:methylase of polypeptide subunit release factors